ncbi:UDP-N-acetyl glucosamine 2-epimerase [Halococcoides cellulosivorans]|uniref:UDP-N-acetyl glucosamine 2-epimerase n=1 Tax=Halococcoides cellulosivorans TaxID=1679096 RepID=A0A2R4X1B3_9EURY|nr:UDP-N-acetylglucosamine 2-epimerase [Halococcoides cellulosivorans]AWB27584.1 UDP-N-acetyl glucosamine 2-epimerase [Halococcoides cellulosivorans]
MTDGMTVHDDRLARQMDAGEFVLAVVTATKPDFYKQAPVVTAAIERGLPVFVLHTGQHYDDHVGHGLSEYDLEERVAVDLGIRGGLTEKTAQVNRRIGALAERLDEDWPDTTVLPMVHGDTHAAGIVPQAWMFATNQAVAHNEAGLRGMSPDYDDHADPAAFVDAQWSGEWSINRAEPFPEQYDTFVGSAASIYQFAPVELNREHLEREGYPRAVDGRERIPVVGNSVVDAIEMKGDDDLDRSVFDVYPVLEERDDWLRVDIHRRANLLPERFTAIVEAVIALVEDGYNVNFVELHATKTALENYGYRDRLQRLADERENFLFTGLWKKHAHVYEFLRSGQCLAEFTDSGSMQEELNEIDEAICLTARYNTDRPETVFEAETNLLVPPIGGEYVTDLIEYVLETDSVRERIQTGPKLYGNAVGETIVDFLDERREEEPFDWAHERVGFESSDQDFAYL